MNRSAYSRDVDSKARRGDTLQPPTSATRSLSREIIAKTKIPRPAFEPIASHLRALFERFSSVVPQSASRALLERRSPERFSRVFRASSERFATDAHFVQKSYAETRAKLERDFLEGSRLFRAYSERFRSLFERDLSNRFATDLRALSERFDRIRPLLDRLFERNGGDPFRLYGFRAFRPIPERISRLYDQSRPNCDGFPSVFPRCLLDRISSELRPIFFNR